MSSNSLFDLVLAPIHVLIIVVGIVGNILVITVVRTTKAMHTTINFLLANLAIADVLTLIWLIPAEVLKFLPHPAGNLGNFLCKFVTRNSVPMLTLSVSGLTFTVIAYERHHALLHPMSPRFRLTTSNIKFALAAVWLVCAALLAPFLFFVEYDQCSNTCIGRWDEIPGVTYYFVFLAVPMIASLITVCFCYFKVVKELYFSNTIMSESVASNGEDRRAKRKIVKLLLILTLIYLVCFTPYISLVLVFAITAKSPFPFYQISLTLMYSNSCMNPIVCAFQSSNYRNCFKRLLFRRTQVDRAQNNEANQAGDNSVFNNNQQLGRISEMVVTENVG